MWLNVVIKPDVTHLTAIFDLRAAAGSFCSEYWWRILFYFFPHILLSDYFRSCMDYIYVVI